MRISIFIQTIKDWFSYRPVIKASSISAFVSLITLIVLFMQTCLFYRQTNIISDQTKISEQQVKLTSNQVELSTRPSIEAVLITSDSSSRTVCKLRIVNKGIFPVRDISLSFAYFAHVVDHGWWVDASTGKWTHDSLLPTEAFTFTLNLSKSFFSINPLKIDEGTEYLLFFLAFDRSIDRKEYLFIKPAIWTSKGLWSEDEFTGMPASNASGALSKLYSPSMELAYEYLRRRPLKRNYEIYNFSYPFGFAPSGKLGTIKWIN